MKRGTQNSVNILPHVGVGGGLTLKDFKKLPSNVTKPKRHPRHKEKCQKDKLISGTHPTCEGVWDSATTPPPPPNPPIKVMYDQRMDVPLSEHCV